MGIRRIAGMNSLMRGVPALVVTLLGRRRWPEPAPWPRQATLAGPRERGAGLISTVAGGVGGPGKARDVRFRGCAACGSPLAACTSPTRGRCGR